MKIFTTIRKIVKVTVSGGGSGFIASQVLSGIKLSTLLSTTIDYVSYGVVLTPVYKLISGQTKVGISFANLSVSGTLHQEPLNIASALAARISEHKTPIDPAVAIQQISYDLTATRYASGSNAEPNGTSTDFGAVNFAWPTPANADGASDNVLATLTSQTGLGAATRVAQLNMPLVPMTGKTDLTINSVNLSLDIDGTSQLLVTMSCHIKIYAGATLLTTRNFDSSSFTTPQDFDLTTAVGGDWGLIPDLVVVQGRVAGDTTGLNPAVIHVDAATLVVTASAIQTI